MAGETFDAVAALAFLDDVTERFGFLDLLSIEPAWDAAWIVCLTSGPRHKAAAQAALAEVTAELNSLSIKAQPAQTGASTAQVPR